MRAYSEKYRVEGSTEADMKENFEKEERIFSDLVAIADAKQRENLLKRLCRDDPALNQRLSALLASHETKDFLIDNSTFSSDLLGELLPSEAAGQFIEGFELLEKIGEGGMGLVFKARQTTPVQRIVALKVLRFGAESKRIVERFEAERQTLALLDHPNITKILDGGITETGRPYFVMEYVDGCPITEYCENNKLNVRQRLRLFCDVCKAIQHAHLRGIIHRDIKPANVLVKLTNDLPIVKVIDFGIAKLIDPDLADTKHTINGQLLGTLGYMSPEQADQGHFGDIDSRTDIYSLGALLYALLTGVTPVEIPKSSNMSILRTLETIRDKEPVCPSTRIHSQQPDEDMPKVAEVKGDLDWIVMKAIHSDRNRRYESAASFARDVERHLVGVPVEAAGPNFWYKVKKHFHKHRTAVVLAGLCVILMLTAAIGGSLLAIKARKAEASANYSKIQEMKMRKAAENQRDRALKAEKQLRQIVHERQSELAKAETENELYRSRVVQSFFDKFYEEFGKTHTEKIDDMHFKYIPRFQFETAAFDQPVIKLGEKQVGEKSDALFSFFCDDFCEDDLRDGQEIVEVDLAGINGIQELMITALEVHQVKCQTMFPENLLLNADAHECLAIHLLAHGNWLAAEPHLKKAVQLHLQLLSEGWTEQGRFNTVRCRALLLICCREQLEERQYEEAARKMTEEIQSLGRKFNWFLTKWTAFRQADVN